MQTDVPRDWLHAMSDRAVPISSLARWMEFVNDCFMESRTIPAADRFWPTPEIPRTGAFDPLLPVATVRFAANRQPKGGWS